MIFIKKEFIINYIKELKKQDIIDYLSKECIPSSKEEIDELYYLIKNKYDEILNSNFMEYIQKYKNTFNKELYLKIIEKYNKYKKFIE